MTSHPVDISLNFMPAFYHKHTVVTYGAPYYFEPRYRAEVECAESRFLYDILGRFGVGSPHPVPSTSLFIQPIDLLKLTQGAELHCPPDASLETWGHPWAGLAPGEVERIDPRAAARHPIVDAIVRQYREMRTLWSWGRLCNAHFYATQGLADRALEQLRHSLDTVMAFAALNESADSGLGRVHHPWFMTAAGAFVRAVTRMLLYPRDEAVFVLPGVPAAWRDLEVELPAHGRVSVKVRVVDGHLAELTLSAAARSDKLMTVFIPKRFLPEARFAGAAARLEGEEGGNWKVAVRLAGARPVRVV